MLCIVMSCDCLAGARLYRCMTYNWIHLNPVFFIWSCLCAMGGLAGYFAEPRIVESVCAGQCHIQLGCELGDSPAAMLLCVCVYNAVLTSIGPAQFKVESMTPQCLVAIPRVRFGRMSFTKRSRKWAVLSAVMSLGLVHQFWKKFWKNAMMKIQTEKSESLLHHGQCSFRARWWLGVVFNPYLYKPTPNLKFWISVSSCCFNSGAGMMFVRIVQVCWLALRRVH